MINEEEEEVNVCFMVNEWKLNFLFEDVCVMENERDVYF